MSEFTVIGSGIAARSFVKWMSKYNPNGQKIVVYSKDSFPYSRMAILDVIKGEIGERQIELGFPEVTGLYFNKEVVLVDADRKELQFKDGEKKAYQKLIIATGAVPKTLNFPEANIPVLTVRNIEDIRTMNRMLNTGKNKVALLGGGFISMETANALHKSGAEIHLIVSSSRVLSRMLPSIASDIVEKTLKKNGIKVYKNSNVKDIIGHTIYLDEGKNLNVDFVVVGKGVKRSLIPVKWQGKEHLDYNANEFFETPFPDIYLIGDALLTKDLVTDRLRHNAIWPTAERQGRHLAKNLTLQERTPYRGDVQYNMLSVFDMYIFAIGHLQEKGYKVNLKTEKSIYMIFEREGKITGIVTINHPLPFARIVKNFLSYGHY